MGLNVLIKKHEELIPSVQKTSVMVDLYWKCYAYGDELKPHIEFLDGIMLSSTRDVAPSCVENVDELIERQEKSLVQLETKRAVVKDLIEKGKVILQNSETIAVEFDKAEEEIKKVKKRFNLAAANEDLKKRQDIYASTKATIDGLDKALNDNFTCMSITAPDDKKKLVEKELKVLLERLNVVGQFNEKVTKVEEFVNALTEFDVSLKTIDDWMQKATAELNDIKNCSASMAPEDRVARTMDLQEDIAAKVEIIKTNTAKELDLLPQGDKIPQDAKDFKDELNRITKYVTDLQIKVQQECDKYSEDVKFWAEYKTGIKGFTPWLSAAEVATTEGLSKPTNLDESKALHDKVHTFEKACLDHLKLLEAANAASQKMTSHETADGEVAALRERYTKVKAVSDSWVAKDKSSEGENQFSLEKMESTLGELKNIFKEKEKLVEGLWTRIHYEI